MWSGRLSNSAPILLGSLRSNPNFVASTTSSRNPATALPTSFSFDPVPPP
jgi:hypothetical protein